MDNVLFEAEVARLCRSSAKRSRGAAAEGVAAIPGLRSTPCFTVHPPARKSADCNCARGNDKRHKHQGQHDASLSKLIFDHRSIIAG
jgi:hypothetical protein